MKQVTDFLIDNSDKMDKKLSVTQKVLTDEIAPKFDFSHTFGMRTFKSICGSPIIIKSLDLAEPNTKDDFIKKATSLPLASGGSPITATVKESLESLAKIDADRKKILLITAGEDTDGGVLEYEVEKRASIAQINIIGVGMKDSDLRAAQKVAQLTNGICCNIPADKINDTSAIRETIAPVVEALLKEAPAAAPQVHVEQAKPVVEEKKITPIIEIKQDVQEEAPKMAAFVQKPQPAQAATEKREERQEPVKKQEVVISNKDFAKETNAIKIATVETHVEDDKFDAVSALKSANEKISELLQSNMNTLQHVLKNGESTRKENEQLRAAEQQNQNSIQQLRKTIQEANNTIQQLKQVVSDKNAEIEALNANKNDLQVTINQWIERDKKVVIDLDSNARQATSAASEKILFDYLGKKYPNRVKWCNEKTKETKGFDFEIIDYENNVTECYIACKGAKDDTKTFFLTEKEWEMCLNNNLNYQVYLVRNVDTNPKIIWIENLIGWMMNGKVRPGALRNEKVKAGQVMLTLSK